MVTGFDETIVRAHTVAQTLSAENIDRFGHAVPVTPLTKEGVNGYRSFAVLPDGSKEGWDTSNQGDEIRSKFLDWMRQQEYEDGSSPLSWAELQYGDDDNDTKVIAYSDEPNGSECRPYVDAAILSP
jgi:hypothetical protein